MAKKEYIERESAFRAILGQPPEPHYPEWYYRNIKELPAADVDAFGGIIDNLVKEMTEERRA